MLKIDVQASEEKTPLAFVHDLQNPQTNIERGVMAAAPGGGKRLSVGGHARRVMLTIFNGIEMIFFKKYAGATRSMSFPTADLMRLNAALRADNFPSKSGTLEND